VCRVTNSLQPPEDQLVLIKKQLFIKVKGTSLPANLGLKFGILQFERTTKLLSTLTS
jgi:hypothetical protein